MPVLIQDERFSVVEDAIHGAFLSLLKEKSVNKITVSDVVKRAGIVRSTFYNHYENVPGLVKALEDQTINDIFSLMESFHPRDDKELCRSFFRAICNYTMTNPFLAELLRSPRGDEFFEKAMTMFHRYVTSVTSNSPLTYYSREQFSYTIAASIGSTIGILHKWSCDNFTAPMDTIIDLLTRIFMTGMLPLIR